ncbi:MAG: hypothetical protein AAFV19_12680 [Pseudomonadota bacterium]
MADRAAPQRRQSRTHEKAAIVLAIGLLLLMPPVANIFTLPQKIAGVPFTLIYLFVVWAGLILSGILMSQRLLEEEDARQTPPGSAPPGAYDHAGGSAGTGRD